MELTQHPQYHVYVQDRELNQRCREGVASWQESGEPIPVEGLSLRWTFERAQQFALDLSYLAQEYNRVLWERFHYCRQCGGQCCRVDASQADEFDFILLALLGQSPPVLPVEIEATARDCIYRTAKGCAWPVTWKPVKCWTYYCLGQSARREGTGRPPADPSDKRYVAITERLSWVILGFLPDALQRCEDHWGESLISYVGEPLDFAEVLNDMLFEIFLSPFNERYPVIET